MKVVFAGSHGTGKTSVALELQRRFAFEGFYFPESSARLFSKVAGINDEADPGTQLMIAVDRHVKLGMYPDVISERSLVDSWAYTKWQAENAWTDQQDEDYNDFVKHYMWMTHEFTKKHANDVDAYFYFPIMWEPEDDGVRLSDVSYQKQIDELIQKGMDKFVQTPILTIQGKTVEERADYVENMVDLIRSW